MIFGCAEKNSNNKWRHSKAQKKGITNLHINKRQLCRSTIGKIWQNLE